MWNKSGFNPEGEKEKKQEGAEGQREKLVPEPLVEMRMDFPSGLNLSPVQSTWQQ